MCYAGVWTSKVCLLILDKRWGKSTRTQGGPDVGERGGGTGNKEVVYLHIKSNWSFLLTPAHRYISLTIIVSKGE